MITWFKIPLILHVNINVIILSQGVLISVILLWRKRVLEVLHLRKPSITKDETLTARPFLSPKNGSVNAMSNGDHDTSLVIGHDQDQ